jgi:hypothetical protein
MSEQDSVAVEETEVMQEGTLVDLKSTALWKADDLKEMPDQRVTLTIAGLKQRTFQDGEKAWLLVFQEDGPGLRLNKTNMAKLVEIMGSTNIREMITRPVTLWYDKSVVMGVKKVGGIRLERAEDLAGAQ